MVLARSIGARFSRFDRPSSRSTDPRHLLGAQGERLAADYLRCHGYKVLYRNFRTKYGGEIDLVGREIATATLVFVEVKTRTREDFGAPGEAVSAAQKGRIIRGAQRWLRMLGDHDRRIPYRFDIVEVIFEGERARVEVLKDAFQIPVYAIG